MRQLCRSLIAFAALVFAISATPAKADQLTYSFSALGTTATFALPSNPTPSVVGSEYLQINNITLSISGIGNETTNIDLFTCRGRRRGQRRQPPQRSATVFRKPFRANSAGWLLSAQRHDDAGRRWRGPCQRNPDRDGAWSRSGTLVSRPAPHGRRRTRYAAAPSHQLMRLTRHPALPQRRSGVPVAFVTRHACAGLNPRHSLANL